MAQVCALITSPTCVTVTLPQVSLAVTLAEFTAGTELAQLTVTAPGHVMEGGVVSTMVNVASRLVTDPDELETTTSYPPAAPTPGLLIV